jgi:predicted transcriptional regulator
MQQRTEDVLKAKAGLFIDPDVPRIQGNENWNNFIQRVNVSPEQTALVIDNENKLIGMITSQEIIGALSEPDKAEKIKANTVTASDIMKELRPDSGTVAQASDTLESVLNILKGKNPLNKRLKVVPIVDQRGSPLGQITRNVIQKRLDDILEE